MAVPTFVFMICSLRTNIMYFLIFLFLVLGFTLLSGSYWQLAQENVTMAHRLQVVSLSKPMIYLRQGLESS